MCHPWKASWLELIPSKKEDTPPEMLAIVGRLVKGKEGTIAIAPLRSRQNCVCLRKLYSSDCIDVFRQRCCTKLRCWYCISIGQPPSKVWYHVLTVPFQGRLEAGLFVFCCCCCCGWYNVHTNTLWPSGQRSYCIAQKYLPDCGVWLAGRANQNRSDSEMRHCANDIPCVPSAGNNGAALCAKRLMNNWVVTQTHLPRRTSAGMSRL